MVFDIATLLNQWEAIGVFDFVLPFLLIFSFVFGILTATNILGKNKGVHIIIALVIGLMALRLPFVSDFFTQVFPRTAIAISIILVAVILTAVFIPKEHFGGWAIGFYSLGAIAAILVIFNSFNALNYFGSTWWSDWGGMIIGALLLVGVIIAVSVSGNDKEAKEAKQVTFGPYRS